jgi:FkbM family methyltransferase
MLISLDYLVNKYNLQLKGVLHVGAHDCEELEFYLKYLPIDKILWVEALSEKVELCKSKYPNILIENAIISDVIEKVKFNIADNGHSSSMLEFGLHSTIHSHVKFIDSFEGETKLLNQIIYNYDICYNFLNFDIQGAELKALKSMEEYLPNVDYIFIEVNADYLYKGCPLIGEIDEYLSKFGFHRVEVVWAGVNGHCKWGDAFYIRK